MSGLIWAGIGQGIANAGRSMGDYMMRAEQDEERQRERAELQRERERAAAEMQKDRLAAQSARTGGNDGGLSAANIGEGGADEGMLARRVGMTVPELRAVRKYSETGDTAPFKQDVTQYSRLQDDTAGPNDEYSDAISRKGAMLAEQTVKELPPGFEAEIKAKAQALAKIEESYRLGGKYNEVTKGRENQFGVDMAQGVIGNKLDAGRASQAVGVMSGKPMVDIKGDTEFSPYIAGQRQTTDVGKSVIAENQAQAGQAAAAGRKSDADAGRINDRSDPETMRMRADYTQRERTLRTQISKAFGDEKTTLQSDLAELVAERKAFEDQVSAKKASAPTAAPSGGGALPEPKTPEEVAKLKPGTRFKAPDGSIRYK